MNDAQPIIVMTMQEKLWWDFIDSHPDFVMWSIGIVLAFIVIVMVRYMLFKP